MPYLVSKSSGKFIKEMDFRCLVDADNEEEAKLFSEEDAEMACAWSEDLEVFEP